MKLTGYTGTPAYSLPTTVAEYSVRTRFFDNQPTRTPSHNGLSGLEGTLKVAITDIENGYNITGDLVLSLGGASYTLNQGNEFTRTYSGLTTDITYPITVTSNHLTDA